MRIPTSSPTTLLLSLLAVSLPSMAAAQSVPKSSSAPAVVTASTTTPAGSSAVTDPMADAPVFYVIYYSSTVNTEDLQAAKARRDKSNIAVKRAIAELNGIKDSGLRVIAKEDISDLAGHLPGGKHEAQLLKPSLEAGWHVLFIMNPDETQWSAPTVLSPYRDVFKQIKDARAEDRETCPKRYLVAAPTLSQGANSLTASRATPTPGSLANATTK